MAWINEKNFQWIGDEIFIENRNHSYNSLKKSTKRSSMIGIEINSDDIELVENENWFLNLTFR